MLVVEEAEGKGRKWFTPEYIIGHLCTVEIESGKGMSVQDICQKLGVCQPTFFRWKRGCGVGRVDQSKHRKALEQENKNRNFKRYVWAIENVAKRRWDVNYAKQRSQHEGGVGYDE